MREKLLRWLPWLVMLTGLTVMLAWLINLESIIRIHSDFSSMKFVTAFLFLLCGLQIYFISRIVDQPRDSHYSKLIFLAVATICLTLLCVAVTFSPGFGRILDVLPEEITYDPWSRIPHLPSSMTLLCFFVISALSLSLISRRITNSLTSPIGIGLILIGFSALIGNLFRLPLLFFATHYSGGVSIHTGLLLILIGVFYYLLLRPGVN